MSDNFEKIHSQLLSEELLVDGLSSYKSYFILSCNVRKGVQVSFRPFVHRVNSHVVMLWAKVRVAFNTPEKQQAAGGTDEDQQAVLETYYKNKKFPQSDYQTWPS